MIRRPPTMIPMSDADIQDIRTLVLNQKAAYDQRQKTLLQMKSLAERSQPIGEGEMDDPATVAMFRQIAEKAREREERHKRLGIQPGKSSS